MKLTKGVKSNLICLEGYMTTWRGMEDKGEGGFATLVRDSLKFWEILTDGSLKQCRMRRITAGKMCSADDNL